MDARSKSGVTTNYLQRMKELEREVRELKRANEILEKAAAFFRGGGSRPQPQVMVAFIDQYRCVYGGELEAI